MVKGEWGVSSELGSSGGPEFELLCACCRQPLQAREIEQLTSGVNWKRLFQLALYHRVSPAVYAYLSNASAIPEDVRATASAWFAHHARRVLRFASELSAILRKFESYGIQALSHKGPVLACLLYGDPAMREFGDLDFLLRAVDIPRAQAALAELGYERQLELSAREEEEYLRSEYELVFGSARERNLVELQWQILPRFYSVPFELETLLSRSIECKFEGSSTRVLHQDDLMLVLCAHAAKHGWAQLGMVRDIARVAQLQLDWDWIKAEARRLGILKILSISLHMAANLLGSKPPELSITGATMVGAQQTISRVENRLRSAEELKPESFHYFHFMMRLRERWRDRLRFTWRLLSTPGVSEWRTVSIPNPLFSLYHGVRAVRLAKRVYSQL